MSEPIDRRSIAAQLAERIKAEILSGTWNSTLPGKRTLADRYRVNVKTCAAALAILEHQGLLSETRVGKMRRILAKPVAARNTAPVVIKRLLVIHQSPGALNVEDFHLLQRMVDGWARAYGESAWEGVDYPRCKSPGAMMDRLIARHSADALLLYMPGSGWGRAAAGRIPFYQTGGSYEKDVPITLGACMLDVEIKRMVEHLVSLGHREILIPTEGFDEKMRNAVLTGLRDAIGGKPRSGTWTDYVPEFSESVPEAWTSYWDRTFNRIRPTAVIVLEDTQLLSLYGYCYTHNIRIPGDLSVMSLSYETRFEWLKPVPAMMRYPTDQAVAHFQQWIDGGLKPLGIKFFKLEMNHGESLGRI